MGSVLPAAKEAGIPVLTWDTDLLPENKDLRAAYIGTTIFVVAGIFEILDIASEIVIWAFILVFGAVCLALALAFGLGGRDVAGRHLERWFERKKDEPGAP